MKSIKLVSKKLAVDERARVARLTRVLAEQIPLSKAMKIKVARCSESYGVEFQLPLRPNRNHKNTAFGGTLIAAQALACWAFICEVLDGANIHAEVVVQRQNGEFLLPVKNNFRVLTDSVSLPARERFLATLEKHSKARLQVTARVLVGDRVAGAYSGEYVAIKSREKIGS